MSQKLPPFSAEQLLQYLLLMPPASSWLVGLSGGADSTALLYALVQLRDQLNTPFRAVHINHGLHSDSNQWQRHCESMCRDWSVPLTCIDVRIEGNGQGLEAEAREKRYAAIAEMLQPNEAVLTAHHADDQVETLLLNLMRGSGVDGLSAMPVQKTFAQFQQLRPLLKFHHQALLDYLDLHKVHWVEDPSNQMLDQDRNFIRNKVLPLLESRFTGTVKRLLLTQKTMAETRQLLDPLAERHLLDGLLQPGVLHISETLISTPALFKLVVRHWLKKTGAPGMPSRQLNGLYTQLQQASSDSKVAVRWADCSIRYYQNCLWLHKGPDIKAVKTIQWPLNEPTSVNESVLKLGHNLGSLSLTSDQPVKPAGKITIVSRQSQPGLSLMRDDHHQSLKNLFQSASIPAWLRDCVPLTLVDDELAAVGDWATSKSFASWLTENHVKFTWQPDAPILQYLADQQHHRTRQTHY